MNEKEKAALFAALRPDDALVQSVKAQARAAGQTSRPLWRLTAAAAALLVIALAAVGVWQLRKPPVDPPDTTAPLVTVPVNPDGSMDYSSLASDGAMAPSIVKSGALSDITAFREEMVRRCDLCFEGTAIDVQYKHYDYRYYYGVKFGEETFIHEQPVTQLTTFRIEKVWHGDTTLVGTTITLEDETIQDMGSVFGYRKGVAYVVLMQDVTGYGVDIWHPVGEERLVEGDVTRSSPYMTYYPWQPQVERAVTGDYIVPTTWKTVTEGCSVKVILEPDALQDSHTAHMLDWFGDQLRLVKADVFRARMAALVAE
ncbi:MAG: hypothetical protein IJL00_02555 [Clostridia bacterium]|nr:hypothetical protein [Clostridia bacterium]